jgi:hypothetical protein
VKTSGKRSYEPEKAAGDAHLVLTTVVKLKKTFPWQMMLPATGFTQLFV